MRQDLFLYRLIILNIAWSNKLTVNSMLPSRQQGFYPKCLQLYEKSREVCIKAKPLPASLAYIGQVIEHTTVNWSIEKQVESEED